jgi:hypothetical protein
VSVPARRRQVAYSRERGLSVRRARSCRRCVPPQYGAKVDLTPNREGGSPFCTQRQNFFSAVNRRCWYRESPKCRSSDGSCQLTLELKSPPSLQPAPCSTPSYKWELAIDPSVLPELERNWYRSMTRTGALGKGVLDHLLPRPQWRIELHQCRHR